ASKFTDRTNPLEWQANLMSKVQGFSSAPPAAQMFGGAGREYRWKYGTKRETFAKVSAKARKHASNNPYALFNQVLTVEEILASDEFAKKHGITKPVWIAAQNMTTDFDTSFKEDSMIKMVGFDMAKDCAKKVYDEAGLGPKDVQVIELHDCFTTNEILTYEALGLCKEGEAEKLIEDGDNTYGGKWVTNPSGGLLSKGHPLGAT